MAANFQEALAEQIALSGLSSYRVSQLAGLGRAAMSKLLLGQAKPGWETVVKIALGLGVSVEVFVTPDITIPEAPEVGSKADPGAEARPREETMTGPQFDDRLIAVWGIVISVVHRSRCSALWPVA